MNIIRHFGRWSSEHCRRGFRSKIFRAQKRKSKPLSRRDTEQYFFTKIWLSFGNCADKASRRLLGVQALGKGAVDKVVDTCVAAIAMKATVDEIADMDFAYAPPFSTAIHPLAHAVNVLMNKMDGDLDSMSPAEFAAGAAEGYRIVDVSLQPSIDSAPYVNLSKIAGEVEGLAKDERLLLVCAKGKRAYMAQNRMKFYGYTNTKALEGGTAFNEIDAEN